MKKILLHLSLAGMLAAGSAHAQIVLIDITGPFQTLAASPYNSFKIGFNGTTGGVADLLTTTGTPTGWSFSFTSTQGVNDAGSTTVPTAVSDLFVDQNAYGTEFRVSSNDTPGVFTQTLAGLNNDLLYDITIWAHTNAGFAGAGKANYEIIVGTASSTTNLFNVDTRQVGTLTTLTGVTPVAGVIQWTLTSSSEDGYNPTRDIGLNAIQVVATPIPEPATYATLVGLLALGLVAWRRRHTV